MMNEKAVTPHFPARFSTTPSQCAGCLEDVVLNRGTPSKFEPLPLSKFPTSHKLCDVDDIYWPLDEGLKEIRLLFVQPGSSPSPIDCTLHTFNLSHYQTPVFDALSYEWGSKKPNAHFSEGSVIYLSRCGGKTSSCIRIRENLFAAIKKLRTSTNILVIWIDAICVDQNNMKERSQQVRLMKMIYTSAKTTHVWLGPQDRNNEAPFDLLYRINRKVKDMSIPVKRINEEKQKSCRAIDEVLRKRKGEEDMKQKLQDNVLFSMLRILDFFPSGRSSPSVEITTSSEKEKSVAAAEENTLSNVRSQDIGDAMAKWCTAQEQDNSHAWQCLLALLNRTYWSRVWIVQEFLLARNITLHCGYESISWDDFVVGLHHILKFTPEIVRPESEKSEWAQHTNSHDFEAILQDVEITKHSIGVRIAMMRQRVMAGGRFQLLELLEATKESRCYDPRDHVFALLGLASDVNDDSIRVDYAKSPLDVQVAVMQFFRNRPVKVGSSYDLTYVTSLLVGILHRY